MNSIFTIAFRLVPLVQELPTCLGRLALFCQKLWEKEGIFILIPLTCPLELYSKEAFNVADCIKYSFAYIASDAL